MTAVRPADEDAARPTDVELISEIENEEKIHVHLNTQLTAVLERIYAGYESHAADRDAVFLWVSDSPELTVAVAREIGMEDVDIAAGLERFRPMPGRCRVCEIGPWTVIDVDTTIADPTLTLTADADDWLAVENGELNPMLAMMQGKVKLKGSIPFATKFMTLFGYGG